MKTFIGREKELATLEALYHEKRFHLFVLYGRRRVGKTTLLNEFCRKKEAIFFSATESSSKFNLEKFSEAIFAHYGESSLAPFTSWDKALSYIDARQGDQRLILVLDEFPYLARKNEALMSELQHLIDHKLQFGRLFIVLSGSYMGFMEKEVLSAKSPLFGRRTGQLHLKGFDYLTSLKFLTGFSPEEQLMLYGALGGTPLYLRQVKPTLSFAANIKQLFLEPTSYLYEEPLLLLRQEVQEPGLYSAIIEAVASGATRANEIATRVGEESAKCLKYIGILCELGLLYKETPFGEKESSRRTIYGISDLMFRFWYRYVYPNRTLLETNATETVWDKCIAPNLSEYMGHIFERVASAYLLRQNALGKLPILFTSLGRWWGTDPVQHTQVEIDLIAQSGHDFVFCECKWRNENTDLKTLEELKRKSRVFTTSGGTFYYYLFSKHGFTKAVHEIAQKDATIRLISCAEMIN